MDLATLVLKVLMWQCFNHSCYESNRYSNVLPAIDLQRRSAATFRIISGVFSKQTAAIHFVNLYFKCSLCTEWLVVLYLHVNTSYFVKKLGCNRVHIPSINGGLMIIFCYYTISLFTTRRWSDRKLTVLHCWQTDIPYDCKVLMIKVQLLNNLCRSRYPHY